MHYPLYNSCSTNRDNRRNRYHIRKHLPVPDKLTRTVGEFLDLLVDTPGDPSP